MKISQIAVDRPILTIVMALLLVFLGTISYFMLPINLFPEINQPTLQVSTEYPDAAPEEVENLVTKPLEEEICSVKKVKKIYSRSSEGWSKIYLDFDWGTNIDFASLEVREKIDRVRKKLPIEIKEPQIEKFNPASWPVMVINFSATSENMNPRVECEEKIVPLLQRIDGVASVDISGGTIPEILVLLDKSKLAARNISEKSVIERLKEENISARAGRIEEGIKEIVVRTTGKFTALEELSNLVISASQRGVVYLRDIARIEQSIKPQRNFARLNGNDCVEVSIYKTPEGNTTKICNEIKKELNRLMKKNQEITLMVSFDQSEYIEDALGMVKGNAISGAILTSIMLWIFLGSLKTLFIIIVSIPLSIIPLFFFFKMMNMSLNIFTFAGIALGVGMVVDNANVILENIFCHIKEGRVPREASVSATTEITMAVISSSLTTIVVFLPVAMVSGLIAELFRDLSYTICISLIISMFIAFTIVPMASARLIKSSLDFSFKQVIQPSFRKAKQNLYTLILSLPRKFNIFFENTLILSYTNTLKKLISSSKKRNIFTLSMVILLIISFLLIPGMEFLPKGASNTFYITANLPVGTSLFETDNVAKKIEKNLKSLKRVKDYSVRINPSNMNFTVVVKNAGHADKVMRSIEKNLRQIPSLYCSMHKATPIPEIGFGITKGVELALKVTGTETDELVKYSKQVKEKMATLPEVIPLKNELLEGRPEIHILLKKDRIAQLGLTTDSAATLLKINLGGEIATSFHYEGKEQDIRVESSTGRKVDIVELSNLPVYTPIGRTVQLKDIAEIVSTEGPTVIDREERQRIMTVTAEISAGSSLSKIMKKLGDKTKGLLSKITWKEGYSVSYGGTTETMEYSFKELYKAMIIAFVLVYMVMAAQFESFFHPFIIMFSIPLSFIGAFIGLAVTGQNLSVTAFLGMILLGGIVVNNAIVLVDYINILRARGMEFTDAITTAGKIRLRPIIMTTGTTIVGALPSALGLGSGGELYRPLAIVVLFGLTSSTILTLFFVPSLYYIFEDIRNSILLLKTRLTFLYKK